MTDRSDTVWIQYLGVLVPSEGDVEFAFRVHSEETVVTGFVQKDQSRGRLDPISRSPFSLPVEVGTLVYYRVVLSLKSRKEAY